MNAAATEIVSVREETVVIVVTVSGNVNAGYLHRLLAAEVIHLQPTRHPPLQSHQKTFGPRMPCHLLVPSHLPIDPLHLQMHPLFLPVVCFYIRYYKSFFRHARLFFFLFALNIGVSNHIFLKIAMLVILFFHVKQGVVLQ
jgi:hypothetical protein